MKVSFSLTQKTNCQLYIIFHTKTSLRMQTLVTHQEFQISFWIIILYKERQLLMIFTFVNVLSL
uniref:Uncharacterized protein n=1 Tax=Solanum tuberosum TaxID=4113 RepID=M1APY7_SOLTU